ncbi:Undecaprenyl-phosphate mannosyltransferase [Phycisphaerae bacterium RAS1]|nr:Undecaprenyl-phosphate mannosyltransferase [Phycisphaerae bacterium RAS1]
MRPLLAIPVFNEQLHLPRVLEAVANYPVDALVIDDGSTDATPELLRKRRGIHVITHPENRGYGQSLIDAFHFAAARRYRWIITMDCDEQHEPAQIPEFLAEIERDRADVISGSRYLRDFAGDDSPPRDRRRINQAVTDLLAQILSLRLTDSFCGFKAHRVSAMSRLRLDEPGYAFPLQFWVQCVRQRLRIREWPVRRIYRDLSREFGGTLDDPAARLQHYLEVLVRELRREPADAGCGEDAIRCGCPLET